MELVGDDESDAGSDAENEEVPPEADADINDALDGECPPLSRELVTKPSGFCM